MIDEKAGVIIPDGGRKKTGARYIAPLTKRAREILEGIRAERRSGAAVPNVSGLVFTDQAGKPISKGQIEYQVAIGLTGVRKFVFHNYRNTALTHWSRQGINVDIAMLASGHSSVQMHKRYVDLQQQDVARHLARLDRKWLHSGIQGNGSDQQGVDLQHGEGRCPVVPLVFKTSLGAVRFPEGSTPSLLRQI